MQKVITIAYKLTDNGQFVSIPVFYTIETTDNMRTIACTVNPGSSVLPFWLQRKFDIRMLFTDGGHELLFNESNIIKNLDTALFIDQAYADIMTKERLRRVPAQPL